MSTWHYFHPSPPSLFVFDCYASLSHSPSLPSVYTCMCDKGLPPSLCHLFPSCYLSVSSSLIPPSASLTTMCTLSLSAFLYLCETKVLSGHFVGEDFVCVCLHACVYLSICVCVCVVEEAVCVCRCGSQRYQISLSRQMHQLKYVCQCGC